MVAPRGNLPSAREKLPGARTLPTATGPPASRDLARPLARRLHPAVDMRSWACVMGIAVLVGAPAGSGRSAGSAGPAAGVGGSSTLLPRTAAAYDAYVAHAETAFLARARSGEAAAPAAAGAGPAPAGRIVRIAGGLVHHWRGSIYVPGVALEHVIATAQRYDAYARIYDPVTESRLLDRDGDRFRVLTRVRGSAGGVSAVLQVRSTVRYERLATSAFSIGASEDIREVADAGEPHESLLPPGRDSGYLWRANTFTRFVQRPGGVVVELETIGLSRRFPHMLGWLIEPIARRLGRRSVERTLHEFDLAIREGGSAPTSQSAPASGGPHDHTRLRHVSSHGAATGARAVRPRAGGAPRPHLR
jgi:hypothetical protein